MESVQDLTVKTPVEIDTVLAEIYAEAQQIRFRLRTLEGWLKRENGRSLASQQAIGDQGARVENYKIKLAELQAEAEPFEAEFARRGGWSRYFLVTNSNGHVHRGMDCGTCFPSTQYAWLVELADCDEDAMITEFGEKACTVCFPTAPANPKFHAPGRRDREAIEARAAEKAAKAAAAAEKAITAPDGSPLRVDGDLIKTKAYAKQRLSGIVQFYGWYGPSHPSDFAAQIRQLVEALEHAGIETTKTIENANKKVKKEGGQHQWVSS